MKRDRLIINLFVLCFAVLVSGCGRQIETGGVHDEDGLPGPDVQTGGASQDAVVIENSGQLVTRSYDLDGFDQVEASMFDLEIRQAQAYKVTIEVEKNALEHIRVSVENGRLKLSLAPGVSYNMVNIPLRAQIAMPAMKGITLDLASDATVTGFDCKDSLHKELALGSSLTCDLGKEQVRFEAEF